MPLDLIGLIQASRGGAVAPGQGFRNYVAGSPVTGTKMTDYMVGTPLVPTSQVQATDPTAKVGQLTVVSQTPDPVSEAVPAYTNVQYTVSYAGGSKADSIYDAAFVAADGANQIKVFGVLVDGTSSHPVGFEWAKVRSYTVNPVAKTITAVVTYHQYYDQSTVQAGDSYEVSVSVQLTFKHDQYFNLRAYSPVPTTPNPPGAVKLMRVQPFLPGQPTHLQWGSSIQVLAPSLTFTTNNPYYPASWITSGDTAQEGSYLYKRVVPGQALSNYYHNGYMMQAQLNGSWIGGFNSAYSSGTGINALNVTYYWQVWNGSAWVTDSTSVRTSIPSSIPDPVLLVYWDYSPLQTGGTPTVASITVRFGAQITSPFVSPIGWSPDYVISVPSYTERTPGGGGVQP